MGYRAIRGVLDFLFPGTLHRIINSAFWEGWREGRATCPRPHASTVEDARREGRPPTLQELHLSEED